MVMSMLRGRVGHHHVQQRPSDECLKGSDIRPMKHRGMTVCQVEPQDRAQNDDHDARDSDAQSQPGTNQPPDGEPDRNTVENDGQTEQRIMVMVTVSMRREGDAIDDGVKRQSQHGDHHGCVSSSTRCGKDLVAKHGQGRPRNGGNDGDDACLRQCLRKNVKNDEAGDADHDESVEATCEGSNTLQAGGEEGTEDYRQQTGDE